MGPVLLYPPVICDHYSRRVSPASLCRGLAFSRAFSVCKQLTAEWAWASAMTCASQSWHRSMQREVRQHCICAPWVLGGVNLGWSSWAEGALRWKNWRRGLNLYTPICLLRRLLRVDNMVFQRLCFNTLGS